MDLRIATRRWLRRFGADVIRPRPTPTDLLARYGVRTVLDVGANVGQYAASLRAWGYRGRILSFEPLSAAFGELAAKARADDEWEAFEVGLGSEDGAAALHVSELSVFSSVRPALPSLRAFDARAAAVREERIEIRALDSLLPALPVAEGPLFLKVDTQGSERDVLRGAARSLGRIVAVQLEASLQPLYEGEALLPELMADLQALGFTLVAAHPVVYHPKTLALLQLDCVFARV